MSEFDLDSFELPEDTEAALAKVREEFIDNQEEVEASSECVGGGCIL